MVQLKGSVESLNLMFYRAFGITHSAVNVRPKINKHQNISMGNITDIHINEVLLLQI